jgi:transcription antitermination protein NusB
MLNRRHLRIKVLQVLYAYFQSEGTDYKNVEKELMNTTERIYDLYLYLLLSFDELKDIEEQKIADNKTKSRDTNERFIENKVLSLLTSSTTLREASEDNKVNWIGDEHREMFKKVMQQVRESELFFNYMQSDTNTFEEDKNFIVSIFKTEIANSELIYNFFEEKSIHWLDDIDLACSAALKTIKQAKENTPIEIMDLFKDPEDEIPFVKTLLRKTIANDKENVQLIDELTKNWELDRIAKMDIILMKMAITELQEFNNIPKKVTLNEYIEISKFYSTPKSSSFINGILDKAIDRLEKENKIQKIGRGLID